MGYLITADGEQRVVVPHLGQWFTAPEIARYVGSPYQIIGLKRDRFMFIDDEGKLRAHPRLNFVANAIAHNDGAIFANDWIAGDALVVKKEEIEW